MQRQQTKEPNMDTEDQKLDMDVEHKMESKRETLQASASNDSEVYAQKEPSAQPETDLRLVVLGGDSADNSYACSTILRLYQREETINPLKGNFIERTVGGRQVSVFRTPSYWMEHLDSHLIFSNGVESIRHEIQSCTSTLFPGPHAFLLVMRAGHTTGKEHYLLRAITSVFGAEALEYTMVMFIHAHEQHHPMDALKDRCVQMCGERFFFLENNDENVEELFMKIKTMTQKKQSRFFIQLLYENLMKTCFDSWERTRLHAQQCREHKLIEEMKAEQQLKETELRRKLETLEQDLRKELEASRLSESALRKDLEGSRLNESALREASRLNESALRKDLEASRLSESALRKDLEGSRFSESALRKDLEGSRLSESAVRKELYESNDRSNKLQREVKEYKEREKELQQKLKDLQAREELLRDRLELEKQKKQKTEELQARERQLEHREKELRSKERELGSSLKEWSQDTAVGRGEEETAESAEAGDVKLARRNSKEWTPPYM
ncbi:GTPase IMAP family member 4-like [Colossoma macropomum]|uniref:GTPase IMAP family member 4-like n=1 Tax=Colossoma macropomum TaxID=42526 RepID=UPI0018647C57|nr:GTPase IMAP family member 4-like [Colossoma macropomum]